MLLARAVRGALVLGLARALALVTDGETETETEEQMTVASSVMQWSASHGRGARWRKNQIWDSDKVKKNVTHPLILVNSKWRQLMRKFQCDLPCTISTRQDDAKKADAIVQNFCSPMFYGMKLGPDDRPAGQKLVMTYDYEAASDPYCATNREQLDSAGIDWTMTYRPDSDIPRPLFSMEPRTQSYTDVQSDWFKFRIKSSAVPNANEKDWTQGRDKLVLWFVSTCHGDRMSRGRSLQKWLKPGQMDIFGHCGDPSPCPGHDEMDECHQKLFKRYKFYAGLENTKCTGYLTEKWARGAVHGLVPLVNGGRNRGDYEKIGLPRDSFIHWDDYNDTHLLARALERIGANKTEYGQFHRWRATHRLITDDENNHRSLCNLCGKLIGKNASHKRSDLGKWWLSDTCQNSRFLYHPRFKPTRKAISPKLLGHPRVKYADLHAAFAPALAQAPARPGGKQLPARGPPGAGAKKNKKKPDSALAKVMQAIKQRRAERREHAPPR